MSGSARACRSQRAATAVLLLVLTWPTGLQAAVAPRSGGGFLSAEGSLFYREASGSASALAVITLRAVAAAMDDEDEDPFGCDHGWGRDCCRDDPCGMPQVPVEAYQFAARAGFYLSPNASLAWRLVVQENDPDDPVRRFWGAGPELTLHGSHVGGLQPFAGAGLLYTRATLASRRGAAPVVTGPSLLGRCGLELAGPEGTVYLQTTYQGRPRRASDEPSPTASRWGIGLGVTLQVQ